MIVKEYFSVCVRVWPGESMIAVFSLSLCLCLCLCLSLSRSLFVCVCVRVCARALVCPGASMIVKEYSSVYRTEMKDAKHGQRPEQASLSSLCVVSLEERARLGRGGGEESARARQQPYPTYISHAAHPFCTAHASTYGIPRSRNRNLESLGLEIWAFGSNIRVGALRAAGLMQQCIRVRGLLVQVIWALKLRFWVIQ